MKKYYTRLNQEAYINWISDCGHYARGYILRIDGGKEKRQWYTNPNGEIKFLGAPDYPCGTDLFETPGDRSFKCLINCKDKF